MKKVLFLFIVVVISISCSSKSGGGTEVADSESALIGTWKVTQINVGDAADGNLRAIALIADVLLNDGCELFSFTFSDNDALVIENKAPHIVPSLNPGCPDETDREIVSWVLEGDVITTTDSEGEENTINIKLEGDMLTLLNGGDIDVLFTGAQAVFTKQ